MSSRDRRADDDLQQALRGFTELLVEQAALAALGEQDFTEAHQHGLIHTTVDSVRKLVGNPNAARSGT